MDVLVAAAGVGSPRPEAGSAKPYTMLNMPIEAFRSVIDVNLYGVLFSNRAVARLMVANGRGGSLDQPRLDHVEDALDRRRLQREQGRRLDGDEVPGPGAGPPRHPGERDRTRLHRDADDRAAAAATPTGAAGPWT